MAPLRQFHQYCDREHRLVSESLQCGYPVRSADFLSVFRKARKCYTTTASSSSSGPTEYMDVEGKCALIVDGTSGVGFAFANELLKMKAANVIITGLDERTGAEAVCDLNERYGPARADFCRADVSDALDFENMFKYTKNHFATLDIFFNNAETHKGKDVIATNLVSKIQGIILACKHMKDGSVILNHTSALGLEPNSEMIAHSAASAGFVVACMAFSENKYFEKTQIRMITLCSELISPMSVGGTAQFARGGQEADIDNITISIAKSAAYVVIHGLKNTLWLCQQNGILSTVELQKIDEFAVKYEPKV